MHLSPWISRWHGHLGVLTAVLVIILIITGVALNHTERLQLDSKFVNESWLLDWYGMGPDKPPISFKVGEDWLTEIDGRLFLNGVLLPAFSGSLIGATTGDGFIVAGTSDALYLFDGDAGLVEKIVQLPREVTQIGHSADVYYVKSEEGIFSSTDGLLTWGLTDKNPSWATPATAPEKIKQSVLLSFRGQGLPWERVVLDLHSGRIFGSWGPYAMDAAAVILFLLVVSGIYNWYARR